MQDRVLHEMSLHHHSEETDTRHCEVVVVTHKPHFFIFLTQHKTQLQLRTTFEATELKPNVTIGRCSHTKHCSYARDIVVKSAQHNEGMTYRSESTDCGGIPNHPYPWPSGQHGPLLGALVDWFVTGTAIRPPNHPFDVSSG